MPPKLLTLNTSPYDLSFKLARHAQFADGYIPTLSNLDQSEVEQLLNTDYEPVPPAQLHSLPANARICYVRRDTGKPVLNVTIVRHHITQRGDALVCVASAPSSTIRLTQRSYQTGVMYAPQHGPNRWYISSLDISDLYVCRGIALADRVVGLEARMAGLDELVSKAAQAIMSICDKIDRLELSIGNLEHATDAALSTKNNQIADLQEHSHRQLELIGKMARRLNAVQTAPAAVLPALTNANSNM